MIDTLTTDRSPAEIPPDTVDHTDNPHHATRWLILGVIALAQLIVVLDATIVNIALPTAQESLGFSNDSRQWIVTGYALAFGSLLLIGGRLSDLVGRRPMFIAGLIGFAAASAVGGAAQNFEMLVGARVAQGVFGALLAPAALSLLTVTFTDAAERARAFAIFGAISGGGGAIGLILGGALTEYLSWRWCLYVNVPLAVLAVVGAVLLLKKQPRPEDAKGIDVPGSLVVVAGLVSFVYGLASAESDGWSSATTLVCIGLGLALLAVFAVVESRVADPLLPLHIVWDRTRGGSFLVVAIVGIGLFAVFLFLTYYVSLTLGYSPLKTGFSFVPMILGIMVTATGSAGLVAKIGPRIPVLVGMLVAAVGMVLFAQLDLESTYAAHILPGLVITGLGVGLSMAPAFSAATSGVDAEHAGVASASVNTFQQIGGSIGTAVLSAFAATATSDYLVGKAPSEANQALAAMHGYTTVFWWSAGIFAVGALLCGALLRSGPVFLDPDAAPVLGH
ncbi:Puromycin resistance protein pur8 [Aeromicrobium sp. Root495]|uniref:MFS transporter n=1 Tax=Aeromicrobium sp. Root495 TaxID=1736550 RepID=UPI000700AD50|nr:MFS transporter [Aeromicrobium sp. Root495]KQY58368.1 Puromycin resistance protein pur8 [Aeromicrobium sp. Root495]